MSGKRHVNVHQVLTGVPVNGDGHLCGICRVLGMVASAAHVSGAEEWGCYTHFIDGKNKAVSDPVTHSKDLSPDSLATESDPLTPSPFCSSHHKEQGPWRPAHH